MTTILVDCDGVLADLVTPYLAMLEEDHGIAATLEDVTDDFSKCVATPKQNRAIWARIASTPGFAQTLPEMPEAMAGLAHLRSWADRVVCVTSPQITGSWMTDRYAWLTARGFDKRDIVLASDKSLVEGDALVDDATHNLKEWADVQPSLPAAYGGGPHAVAIAAPYNTDWAGPRESDLLTASVYLQSVLG